MTERPISFLVDTIQGIRAGRVTQTRRPAGMHSNCLPGEHLWVREPFHLLGAVEHLAPRKAVEVKPDIHFAADGPPPPGFGRRRAARELPRTHHRYHLLIRSVRIEHLQAISDQDVRAEGYASLGEFRRDWDELHAATVFSINGERVYWADNPRVTIIAFDFVDAQLFFPEPPRPTRPRIRAGGRSRFVSTPPVSAEQLRQAAQRRIELGLQIQREAEARSLRFAEAGRLTTRHPLPLDRPAPQAVAVAPGDTRPRAWTREPCGRCGTRGDIGCEHQLPMEASL
jgi:hypothetical protein